MLAVVYTGSDEMAKKEQGKNNDANESEDDKSTVGSSDRY